MAAPAPQRRRRSLAPSACRSRSGGRPNVHASGAGAAVPPSKPPHPRLPAPQTVPHSLPSSAHGATGSEKLQLESPRPQKTESPRFQNSFAFPSSSHDFLSRVPDGQPLRQTAGGTSPPWGQNPSLRLGPDGSSSHPSPGLGQAGLRTAACYFWKSPSGGNGRRVGV